MIEQNLADSGFGVEQIAGMVGMARWRLQALLSVENTNVSELPSKVRRDLALERLAHGSEVISVIATDLGYSSRSNFARAVRKWTGTSPRQYRAKYHA